MKFFAGIIVALLLAVFGSTDTQAQTYYLGNSSTVGVTNVTLQSTCGPLGTFNIPANTVIPVPVPVGCTVTGITYQAMFFPVGYFGPAPPPNPPNQLIVTIGRAVFLP